MTGPAPHALLGSTENDALEVLDEHGVVYLVGEQGAVMRLSARGSDIWRLASTVSVAELAAAWASVSGLWLEEAEIEIGELITVVSTFKDSSPGAVKGEVEPATSMAARSDAYAAPPPAPVPRRSPPSWRTNPQVLGNHFAKEVYAQFDRERFYSWCRHPATARIYLRTEDVEPGTARAGRLPDPTAAPQLFDLYRGDGVPLTLLLNHCEGVASELQCLREALPPGPKWREDDIVATLSAPESGIGFHAGHEDGYIVQLRGSRRWRVWPSESLPPGYVRSLLGQRQDESPPVLPRPGVAPLVDCTLRAGDVLYIPALYPHEGITLEESLSLSIAWRGLSPFHLLGPLVDRSSGSVDSALQRHPDVFYRLLPDPPSDCESVEFFEHELAAALELLGTSAPPPAQLRSHLEQLLRS